MSDQDENGRCSLARPTGRERRASDHDENGRRALVGRATLSPAMVP